MKRSIDLKFWLGVCISLLLIVYLFRDIDPRQLFAELKQVDYRYILLAVVCTFISYGLRAVRWHYLLISEKQIPLSSLYPATVIGYMANNLLPARLGELVRAYVLARREGLPVASVFASLVIDRLFDGATVLLVLLITLFTLQLPPEMSNAGSMLRGGGICMLLLYCGAAMFLFLLRRQTMKTLSFVGYILKPFPRIVSDRVLPLLGSFISGIRLSSHGGHIAVLLASSISIWFFCILPVDLVLRGFGIHLPFTASMFILVLLVFAVMVPAAPGFIGTYHYACKTGLLVFGVAESTSLSIALVIHGIAFFPAIVAGFYHLWREKLSFSEVRNAGTSS